MTHQLLLHLLESSSDLDPRVALLAMGPAAAIGFYTYVWKRYRNTDKSYRYEATTHIDLSNLQSMDNLDHNIARTRRDKVEGYEYSQNPRNRLRMR